MMLSFNHASDRRISLSLFVRFNLESQVRPSSFTGLDEIIIGSSADFSISKDDTEERGCLNGKVVDNDEG